MTLLSCRILNNPAQTGIQYNCDFRCFITAIKSVTPRFKLGVFCIRLQDVIIGAVAETTLNHGQLRLLNFKSNVYNVIFHLLQSICDSDTLSVQSTSSLTILSTILDGVSHAR